MQVTTVVDLVRVAEALGVTAGALLRSVEQLGGGDAEHAREVQ